MDLSIPELTLTRGNHISPNFILFLYLIEANYKDSMGIKQDPKTLLFCAECDV